MARLIDADKLREDWLTNGENEHIYDTYAFLDSIDEQPTVDAVEVIHGHWEYGKWEQGHWVKGNERCRCSVCHRDFAVDNSNIWHGCPQCLAKMDGGNEGG